MKFIIESTVYRLVVILSVLAASTVIYAQYYNPNALAHAISYLWLSAIVFVLWVVPYKVLPYFSSLGLSLWSLYVWMQTVYHRAFEIYGRIGTAISMRSDVFGFSESVKEFLRLSDLIFLVIPIIFIILMVFIKPKHQKPTRLFRWILGGITLILLIPLGVNAMNYRTQMLENRNSIDTYQYYKTDHFIYETIPSTNAVVEKFGLLGLLQRDLRYLMLDPLLTTDAKQNQEVEALLASKEATTHNDYTGILAGKSIIIIQAESLMNVAIDPILTPTLYRLQNEGLVVDQFDAPLMFGSTSDTELMSMTSLLPSNDGYVTFHKYYNNTFPVTLANTFTNNGYLSFAAHNNYAEYYNRGVMLPHLGFEFFDSYKMGFEGSEILDSDYLASLKWIFLEQPKFLAYWITYNGHQPYQLDLLDERLHDYYLKVDALYPELPEGEKVYMAKNMDLDKGLETLLYDFENNGRMNNVVIMLYGDHFAKGLFQDPNFSKSYCESRDLNVETCLYTPMIVWNNGYTKGNIHKSMNSLDISPTVYDLMGFSVDETNLLGHSIFDPNYKGFSFTAWGDYLLTDVNYSESRDDSGDIYEGLDPESKQTIDSIRTMLRVGPYIIENDYFK